MIARVTLTLPVALHEQLRQHLFPGDGLEAAAILLCSCVPGSRRRFLAKQAIFVPYAACALRQQDAITWSGKYLEQAIDAAEADGLAIFVVHSHPGGLLAFSPADDKSDAIVMPTLFHALGDQHGAAIMVPDGEMRARIYDPKMRCQSIDLVSVAGDDIRYWWDDSTQHGTAARPVAFTSDMTMELGRLSAVVIGVSGTGSVVAEQAARLGFGKVILIDFDRIEDRNLNRIINSAIAGAADRQLKVDMFAQAIRTYRGDGVGQAVPASISSREAVLAASQGDVIFCCVDTLEARYIADLIGAAFLIPLFDVGVVIPTRKTGTGAAIADVCGRIDYVQPGGTTLRDRGVYSAASLEAEYLRNTSRGAFEERVRAGYMPGLAEQAPAVITLNMRAASACVMEFIARAYPFRLESNREYARSMFSLAACEEEHHSEDSFVKTTDVNLARGCKEPLLGLPSLKVKQHKVLR